MINAQSNLRLSCIERQCCFHWRDCEFLGISGHGMSRAPEVVVYGRGHATCVWVWHAIRLWHHFGP